MSKRFSHHSQRTGEPPASSEQFAPNKVLRPGQLEIVVGLVVYVVVAFVGVSQFRQLGLDPGG